MQKPSRKNSHKERIFSLPQNTIDFGYRKEHQGKIINEQKAVFNRLVQPPSALTANKARDLLNKVNGWQMTVDYKMIYREFILNSFMAAVDMIDRIADIAEVEKHHPDIHLTQYRNLRIALTTHDVGGLTEKDFAVASRINDLPPYQPTQKAKPAKKPRFEQKGVQMKPKKAVRPVLKKKRISKALASSK